MMLKKLMDEAFKQNLKDFIELVKEITKTLSKETKYGSNIEFYGKLAKIKACGKIIFVGDLHGDLESLVYILKKSNFIKRAKENRDVLMIFLGDYGDRGPFSVEVYYLVLKLKENFPDKILMLRGNHEGPDDLLAYPHDLPFQLNQRFGDSGKEAYKVLRGLFNELLNAVLVKERCLVVHGGIPANANNIEDFAFAHERHPNETLLEEILWSDPYEGIRGTIPSPRGAGKLFGSDVTMRVLERLGVNFLVRGHEPCDNGFKLNHNGKVLTFFSRKGPPYFNNYAAYLEVDLSEKFNDGKELIPFIVRF